MARTNTKAQILDILIRMGGRGATTRELIHDTFDPAAARRVWDLQHEDGHRIQKKKDGPGIYRWVYLGPPLPAPTQMTFDELRGILRAVPRG
jgi:hypothetical protein